MVIGYWEQACALLNYGLLREDLFFATSGEFFGVCELLEAGRATISRAVQRSYHARKPGKGGVTLRSMAGAARTR